jgi:signal transduction histidine kinase
VADEHAAHARERQVRISVTAPDQLFATADPELVRQLIGNLVSNAVRYNRQEGAVRVELAAVGDGRVRVVVADTGIGIPQQHRERIFERFYRIDAHRSRQSGGTGLGLAIVKQVLTVLGGTITLDSSEGGSVFTVTLPERTP